MKLGSYITAMAVLASVAATPVLADPGHGKRHKNSEHRRGDDDHRRNVVAVGHCPPGLAKKSPACVPPGQARKHHRDRDRDYDRDYRRVGEVLRVRDYTIIRDVDRYGFDRRSGWDYYRDGNRAYRVDSNTRKILAVMELIDAFN